MEEEIDYFTIPSGFLMCLNGECAKAGSCLRRLAEESTPPTVERYCIVNPKYLAALQGDCPYYRAAEKQHYAKGFINMLGNLPHNKIEAVVHKLISQFGRNRYYRLRKGEYLLSPENQQKVLDIIENSGVSPS
jgi:hypothetical protein